MYVSRYLRTDQDKFFKGCLPQILFGSFLNTLTHIVVSIREKVSEAMMRCYNSLKQN